MNMKTKKLLFFFYYNQITLSKIAKATTWR